MPVLPQGLSGPFLLALSGLVAYWTTRLGWIILVFWRNSRSPLRNLPGPRGTSSWIAGHTVELVTGEAMEALEAWTRDYGDNVVIRGPFGKNILVTTDLRAITHVLFANYVFQKPPPERRIVASVVGTQGVLWAEEEQHMNQRRVLNPAFGHAQMQDITPMFLEDSAKLRDIWVNMCVAAGGTARVDAVGWLSKAAIAIIARAGFDYDAGTLSEHGGTSKMATALNDIFRTDNMPEQHVQMILSTYLPFYRTLFPDEVTRRLKKCRVSLDEVGMEILRDRKAAVLAESGLQEKDLPRGKDLMSVLLRANLAADLDPSLQLSDAEALAQIPTFLFAAYETTSTTTAWALYSLSKYPEMQARLRVELQNTSTDTPTLDLLNKFSYLDNVVRETIRLYNITTYLTREVFKDDSIPLGRPADGRDGTALAHIGVQQGDQVIVPIWLVNRSERIWGPDASEFRPERWENVPEEASTIPGITPGLMSFSGGPRACIGHRFAVAEIKVLLFHLVRGFEFRLAVEPGEIWARSGQLLHPQLRSDNSVQLPLLITPVA